VEHQVDYHEGCYIRNGEPNHQEQHEGQSERDLEGEVDAGDLNGGQELKVEEDGRKVRGSEGHVQGLIPSCFGTGAGT